MKNPDPIAITQELVRINTVNPPGNEGRIAEYLSPLLAEAGFSIREVSYEPGRSGLLATLSRGDGPFLCFSGHLDTVPVGESAWTEDPFGGVIRGDRLYGRGSTDMKGGVAALTTAAIESAQDPDSAVNLMLAFSPAEETLCEGANAIVAQVKELSEVGAIVVAEPTDNTVRIGHKGALWLELNFEGVSAHGSMPGLGRNAVHAAAASVMKLAALGPEIGPKGALGAPTLNVGTFRGGANINSVPDAAVVQLDIRTVSDFDSDMALELVRNTIGREIRTRTIQSLSAVFTDPEHPWITRVNDLALRAGWDAAPTPGLSYFTDAGILQPACNGAPTVFIGPGKPDLAHQTNEWCSIAQIRAAHEMYLGICRDFAEPPAP